MAIARSPAVALMPDVTIKPLRSKANAVINLMGSAGGILVLILGMVFATSAVRNSLMSYVGYFSTIALIMIIALAICGGVVYSYKKKKASVDYPLDQYAKLNLTKSNDNFVREYTTRTYCPRSNGNSGGGGSRHGGGGGHRGGR